MNKTVHLDAVLVRVTIPAKFIRKTYGVHYKQAPETKVYQTLEAAFGVCLGRCNWENPIEITAPLAQFGAFICLLKAQSMNDLLNEITYHMFTPGTPKPTITRFNVTGGNGKRLIVPVEAIEEDYHDEHR